MHGANRVYVQLVRTLGARGVIRIGGNTSDYAHYAAAARPVSSALGTVVNDAVLKDLEGFLVGTFQHRLSRAAFSKPPDGN